MKKVLNYRAVPIFLLALILCICVACFLHFAFGIAIIAAALMMFGACFVVKRFRKYTARALMILCAVIIGFASTWISLDIRGVAPAEVGSGIVVLEGVIDNTSPFNAQGEVVDSDLLYLRDAKVDVDGVEQKLDGLVKLEGLLESVFDKYKVGDRVILSANVAKIPINVADQGSVGNFRDFVNYRAVRSELIQHIDGSYNVFDSIKIGVKSILTKYCGKSANVMFAMIFGDTYGISDTDRSNISGVGLAHLLAISGLHVAMFALLVMYFCNKLKIREWLKIAILAALLMMFNILCCFSPSVVRASIMIIICYVAKAIGMRNDSISTLSFAACVILIARPFYLYDLSFIMSFMSVMSLIFLSGSLRKRLSFLPRTIGEVTSSSIAVNFGMLPVMTHYFGVVTYILVLANLLILPIISFVYPIMISLICIGFIPYMGYLLVPIGYIFQGFTGIVGLLAKIPLGGIYINTPWLLIIPYIILMVVLSKYFMADPIVKRIAASVMVLGIITVTLLGSNMILRRNKITAVGRYYDAYVITTDSGNNYAVFNADINVVSVVNFMKYAQRNHLTRFEAIIAADITEDEIRVLSTQFAAIEVRSIYTSSNGDDLTEWLIADYYTYSPNDDIDVNFNSNEEMIITIEGVDVLFSQADKLTYNAYGCKIMYAPNAAAHALMYAPDYIVSNDGNEELLPNCVPNSFTFSIVNGTIKARDAV